LPLGPFRILLPQIAERITDNVRNIDRLEVSCVPLVETQKLAARGQVIVHDIEDLAVNSFD
jgi:hypothetical protein